MNTFEEKKNNRRNHVLELLIYKEGRLEIKRVLLYDFYFLVQYQPMKIRVVKKCAYTTVKGCDGLQQN